MTKMMVPATTATGIANWRYAKVISGCRPRILDTTTVPTIPSSRLSAKQSKVPIKVTSNMRTGMPYQRDRGVLGGRGILLTYTIQSVEGEVGKQSIKYGGDRFVGPSEQELPTRLRNGYWCIKGKACRRQHQQLRAVQRRSSGRRLSRRRQTGFAMPWRARLR